MFDHGIFRRDKNKEKVNELQLVEIPSNNQNQTMTENVWPKPGRDPINESEYSLCLLKKALMGTISGVIFLLFSGLVFLLTMIMASNNGGETMLATFLMNIVAFFVVLLVIHLIKIKVTGTSNDVTIALLLRYYDFGMLCMIVYVTCLFSLEPNFYKLSVSDNSFFEISIGIVFGISIILAIYPGTIRERCMRFFFMWPLHNQNSEPLQPNKLLHLLWISRQFLQLIVIGYVACLTDSIIAHMEEIEQKSHYEYNILRAYFAAGFCEEYVKFFLAAGVPFISKYRSSKSAILHVSIMISVAFELLEDIEYVMAEPKTLLILAQRLPFLPLHFVFAYPTAVVITRQRDSLLWILELISAFTLGVSVHGTFDYLLFIADDDLTSWCMYVAAYGLGPLLSLFGLFILIVNPFLPKDESESHTDAQIAVKQNDE